MNVAMDCDTEMGDEQNTHDSDLWLSKFSETVNPPSHVST